MTALKWILFDLEQILWQRARVSFLLLHRLNQLFFAPGDKTGMILCPVCTVNLQVRGSCRRNAVLGAGGMTPVCLLRVQTHWAAGAAILSFVRGASHPLQVNFQGLRGSAPFEPTITAAG